MLHLMNKTFLVGRLWSPESRLSGNYQKIFLSVLSFCFFSFFDLRAKSSTSINLICIENTEIDCPRRVKPISFFIWTPSEPMNGHFLVESYERDRKSIFKFWIRSEIWFFMHVWSTNFALHFWSDFGSFSNINVWSRIRSTQDLKSNRTKIAISAKIINSEEKVSEPGDMLHAWLPS